MRRSPLDAQAAVSTQGIAEPPQGLPAPDRIQLEAEVLDTLAQAIEARSNVLRPGPVDCG